MGEQRPMFLFRLPWMLPSAPAPRPEAVTRSPPRATTTQTPTTSAETQTPTPAPAPAPAQRQPFRFAGIAPSQPPPPQAQTSPRTDSQFTTTQTQAPTTQTTLQTPSPAQAAASTSTTPIPPTVENQSLTETTTTPTPTIPPQMPPLRSPRQVVVQEPLPQAEPLSKTESRPSSPSRASPQSRAAFQPPSPARVSPQAQAASQPSSPALPQPQKSSQTVRQPRYSLLPFQSSGQTSSIPSSPSLTATNVQPTGGTATPPPSPSKTLKPIESSQPPPSSHKALSPVSEEEQNLAVTQPQSLEAQSKTDITKGPISTSPIKATIQPTVTVAQPSKQPGPTEATAPTPVVAKEIPFPTTKSDDYPKSLTNSDGYPVETKKEKEMVQNTTAVAQEEPKQKTFAEYSTEETGLIAHMKEQPKVAYQAEEKQMEKQEMVLKKEVTNLNTSILNGKQTKATISHQKDKSTVSESRQKPMVSNGERVSLQKEIRNDIFKLVHKMSIPHPEHPMDEKPSSVISLVGDNRGASMQLGSEAAKREAVHIHRGYKINSDESAEATTDGEERSKGRRSKDAKTKEDKVTKAYINSNIQNLNNSILLNSSIAERNPGVHLALSHYPTEPIKSNARTESHETRKAEVNITPLEKLAYKPTILRGLYMEPSDSDPDNPEKPLSLGSSDGCRDENKDNEIDSDPDNPEKPLSLGSSDGCRDENKDNKIDVI